MSNAIQIATWFVTILLGLLIYSKALDLRDVSVKLKVLGFGFSVILAYGVFLLRVPLPYLRFAIMLAASAMFSAIAAGTKFDLAVTVTIISIGASHGLFLLFSFFATSMIRIVIGARSDVAASLSAIAMQTIFIILIFKVRRLRKGFLFLHRRGAGAAGIVISGIILVIIALINNGRVPADTGAWAITGVGICIAGLLIWWRRGLTKLYREKIRERNEKEYEKMIAERDDLIRKLRDDNESMSGVIHKDNKILPSMRDAIMLLLSTGDKSSSKFLLEQITQYIEERAVRIGRIQIENMKLPTTDNIVIDGILNHMMTLASMEGVQFDIAEIHSLSELDETIIPASKLQTLFAYLIDNAINATPGCELRRVLISFGVNEGAYELSVQDSGRPFELETLLDLGIKKASTRLGAGGSGIGYMTIFEILHSCNASLIVVEYDPKQKEFTKSVTARFDGKDNYIVQTHRASALIALRDSAENSNESLTILFSQE